LSQLLEYFEMAVEAVKARSRGRRSDFGQIAVELETALGAYEASKLIEEAERELDLVPLLG
jgi:hypothetical protein